MAPGEAAAVVAVPVNQAGAKLDDIYGWHFTLFALLVGIKL